MYQLSVVLQSPRPEDTEFILAGSLALEPSLEQSERVRDWVGLRPGRDSVRLERETRDGLEIVHNYGHGGSGITVFQVRQVPSKHVVSEEAGGGG